MVIVRAGIVIYPGRGTTVAACVTFHLAVPRSQLFIRFSHIDPAGVLVIESIDHVTQDYSAKCQMSGLIGWPLNTVSAELVIS